MRDKAHHRVALAGLAILLAVAAHIPVANADDAAPPLPARTAKGGSEIERFCSNIADAAKDRRYAIQTAELEKLKADVDARMAKLEAKRAEYEGWLKRRQDFMTKAEESVVAIYAKMKPDAAAERLAGLDPELAAAMLMKIAPRQAGVILNEMDSKQAAKLTSIMAAAARPEDPS